MSTQHRDDPAGRSHRYEIELTYPTTEELRAARLLLARHGIHTRQDVVGYTAYGTSPNRRLMKALGQVAMTLRCHVCRDHHLDPSHKDALALELCARCYEEGGLENEHSDYGHDTPVANCPACRAEEVTP